MARDEIISTALSEDEARVIRGVARKDGDSVSAWCRRAILQRAVERVEEFVAEARAERAGETTEGEETA